MKKHLTYISVIILTVLSFFLPLYSSSIKLIVTPDFGRSDSFYGSVPFKLLLSEALHNRTLPDWNMDLGLGFPLLAQSEIGTFFLPNLIAFSLFDFSAAYTGTLIFAVFILALGVYFLLCYLGFSKSVSLFGGVAFALSGGVIPHLTHFSLIQSLSLMPWIILFGLKLNKSHLSFVFILGILLSQQLFAGFPQAVLITLVSLLVVIFCVESTKKDKLYSLVKLSLSIVIAFLLSASQILPSLEFTRFIYSSSGFSQADATYFSFPIEHLLTYLSPFILGNPQKGTYPFLDQSAGSIFWENVGFAGLLPLVLISGLFLSKKRHKLLFTSLIILGVGLLLMLGKYSPFYFIFSFWPFNLFRVPSRFNWMFLVGLVILVSIGLERFTQQLSKQRHKLIFVCGLILFHTFLMYRLWWSYHLIDQADVWLELPKMAKTIQNETVYSTQGLNIHNNLMRQSGWSEPEEYSMLRNYLIPNTTAYWKIPTVLSSSSRPLARTSIIDTLLEDTEAKATQSAQNTKIFANLLHTFGVKHFITSLDFSNPEWTLTNKETSPAGNVYRFTLNTAAPLVYLPQETKMIQSIEEGIGILTDPEFRPGKTVVVEDDLSNKISTPSGQIEAIKKGAKSIEFKVLNQQNPGLVVLQQTFYPGWKVYINDMQTKIIPINIRNLGVEIPAGNSEVRFEFDSASLKNGLYLSLSGYLFALLIIFKNRSKILTPLL